MIIFNQSEEIPAAPEEVLDFTRGCGIVQAVSTVACPCLEDFCRRMRGHFEVAVMPDQVMASIRNCFLALLARYEITYTPVSPENKSLRIRVQTASGWGETILPIST